MRFLILTVALLASTASFAAELMPNDVIQAGPGSGPRMNYLRPVLPPGVTVEDYESLRSPRVTESYTDFEHSVVPVRPVAKFNPMDIARQCSRRGSKWTLSVDESDEGFSVSCKAEKTP